MSDPHQSGDWPSRTTPLNTTPPPSTRASDQLEEELRLKRKKRIPTLVSLAIGAALAAAAYAFFAAQQGSFSQAGQKVDEDLSEAKASSVFAGQRAATVTGDAARAAGANIDTAIDRATTGETPNAEPKSESPKN